MRVENGAKAAAQVEDDEAAGYYIGREVTDGVSAEKGAKTAAVARDSLVAAQMSQGAARQERQQLHYFEVACTDALWDSEGKSIDPSAGERPAPDFLLPLAEGVAIGAAPWLGGKAAAYLHNRLGDGLVRHFEGERATLTEALEHKQNDLNRVNRTMERVHEDRRHNRRPDLAKKGRQVEIKQKNYAKAVAKIQAQLAATTQQIANTAADFAKRAPEVVSAGRKVGGKVAVAALCLEVGKVAYDNCTEPDGLCSEAIDGLKALISE